MTKQERIQEILLNDMTMLRNVVSELNSWNNCLEHLEVWENDEEFFNTFFEGKPMEAVRSTYYGEYSYMDEYVKFNGYGNLESLSEYELEEELKSNIEDIVEEIFNNECNCCFDTEIDDILAEDEEEDEE